MLLENLAYDEGQKKFFIDDDLIEGLKCSYGSTTEPHCSCAIESNMERRRLKCCKTLSRKVGYWLDRISGEADQLMNGFTVYSGKIPKKDSQPGPVSKLVEHPKQEVAKLAQKSGTSVPSASTDLVRRAELGSAKKEKESKC